MRSQGVQRLSDLNISLSKPDYLVMSNLIRDLKSAIDQFAKGKVLDVGCGNKPYEQFFSHAHQYIGCDVVQSSLHKVDEICKATDLSFGESSFDTVFTTQVIEHVEDPFRMLAEISRVLKPQGYLILSAPFSWEIHEAPYDFYRYSKYGLEHMIRSAGFDLVYCKSNGGKWAAIFQLNLNVIYSAFKKKNWFVRFLKILFMHGGLTRCLNIVGRWMDKRFYDDILTLNYVLVARKK
jgi:SAM-dependent methyltransferase